MMKMKETAPLMAALSLALWMPTVVSAQASSDPQSMTGNSVSAGQMVATRAGLVGTLNAKDSKPGEEFQAKLPRKVLLKDGTELPAGTMLIGKVGQDDMNVDGKSKLVLCIDTAKLKDGKTVAVKATIVGIYRPGDGSADDNQSAAGDQGPNPWHDGITKIDEMDALRHVDLHSDLNSANSGVLVSKGGDDITLKSGTELALAIAGTDVKQ